MAEVLKYGNSFTKLRKFSKAIPIITFLVIPLFLSAQIPDSCSSQWEQLAFLEDSALEAAFPDFLDCCGRRCEGSKDSLLARAFHIKALILMDEGQFLQAIATNKTALSIRQKASPLNPSDIGHSHLNLGIIFSHELHRYQQAKKQLDSAWLFLSQGKNYELRGDCMLEKALLMQKQGDFSQSFLLIDQALNNYQHLPEDQQTFLVANAYLARGELFTDLKKYTDASQTYHEALGMYESVGDLFEKAKVLHDLGHLEMQQQNWQEAYVFFQKGIKVYQQLSADYQDIPEALDYIRTQRIKSTIGLGSCLTKLKSFAQAEKELGAALQQTLPNQINLKAAIANNLGELYLRWGSKSKEALSFLNTGLSFLFSDFSPQTPLDCPKLTENRLFQGEVDLLLTLVLDKAEALQTVASTLAQQAQTPYLEAALEHYLLADRLSFLFRKNQQTEASRLFWQQENRSLYEAALDLCIRLNQAELAFQLMENSKALVLLEALKDAVAKASAGISEADLQAEQQLKAAIAQVAARLAGTEEASEKMFLQKKLDELTLEQSALRESFRERYPQYFTYKYGQWTQTVEQIRMSLGKTGLLEFFEGKKAMYICYLDQDTLIFSKIEKELKLLEDFMLAVKNPLLDPAMVTNAYQVYAHLFASLSQIALPKKLYIVPDGHLTQIPFDALCSSPELINNQPAFLLNTHQISYAYSASVLFQATMESEKKLKRLLAVAPISFEPLKLTRLPHSEAEVTHIIQTIGGTALLGNTATKSAFVNQSKNHLLLHLSTHAAADSTGVPWIAFKDSFMYLPAIYGLETQAQLVVLSACQTSQGKLAVGEGVMSLARAFRYAGVPSVLASMWESEDAAASFIMEAFYQKLQAGVSKDEALTEAKRAYLNEPAHFAFRSPFFWSHFILVGDVSELGKLEKSGKLGGNEIKLLLGLLLTLIIYFYFRNRNRKKYAPPQ